MIKKDGIERKLIIRNAVLEDSGKYVCSTVDKKNQTEAELIVKGNWSICFKIVASLLF